MGEPLANGCHPILSIFDNEAKWSLTAYFCIPVPLADVSDDFAHGDLAIRGAFKIADHFTGWGQLGKTQSLWS
jgi:hypothetical protein